MLPELPAASSQQPPQPLQEGQRRWGPDSAMLTKMAGSWTADTVSKLVGDDDLLQGDVVGVISPAALLGPALGRLVRALAASSHFRVDRFSELRVLTDTLGAHARAAASDHRLAFAITAGDRRLEISAGHFVPGSGTVFTGDGSASPASPLRRLCRRADRGPRPTRRDRKACGLRPEVACSHKRRCSEQADRLDSRKRTIRLLDGIDLRSARQGPTR